MVRRNDREPRVSVGGFTIPVGIVLAAGAAVLFTAHDYSGKIFSADKDTIEDSSGGTLAHYEVGGQSPYGGVDIKNTGEKAAWVELDDGSSVVMDAGTHALVQCVDDAESRLRVQPAGVDKIGFVVLTGTGITDIPQLRNAGVPNC